jgi:AcrR family transcriptional regulator
MDRQLHFLTERPPMDSGSRPPQQARSIRTEERLLTATIGVIEAKGLAGATIPEIAAAAGVATGSIYRRFTDKEALIRAAFLRLLERSQEANRAALTPERFAGMSLEEALHVVTRGLVRQYRAHTSVLKALQQFLDNRSDAVFQERAVTLTAGNLQRLVEALLAHRGRIASPDPERAITFALLSAITVIEIHTLRAPALWRRMLDLDDAELAVEAARTMAAYLMSPDASG